ncbi:hypothetical protein B0I73DRAFT_128834 [Yarrowia lipolytica]|jgi:transcriptional repressor NF-X1|uniref:YALI0D10285p n=2 Tax=Yarrowia lipolytica TaxID=4952 RepID=Q6C9L0_YARLI|nr:YALI0D10285p [Yarrowia lipolytica CLIB122]AOW03873.1 hypothetical protein YALI1_D12964g [Yarrowia lipolytica]KAB8283071.1 hypothetical protein BKA91DRAFT_137433 [Yarrowia lipolytica]KAE8168995.1 hypothetical protein BKA90DRAFT_143353 [Yarrowia lipolytica]KAJ8054555.1 hypothetical protein LXG23DRAFT_56110 [Yarrowia lipolytica]QNP97763.1 FKBP12-associated protein 1 [Yarrowia lipolytica]|eukprot:XP_502652.1 YALI0D10285p [Yarrowia lipolytica CLIB122]
MSNNSLGAIPASDSESDGVYEQTASEFESEIELETNENEHENNNAESVALEDLCLNGAASEVPSLEQNDENDVSDVSEEDDSDAHSETSFQDITDQLIAEISAGEYPCLICTEDITPKSKIWNCPTCYRVYDIDCISDWAGRGLKAPIPPGEANKNKRPNWKCPSCNGAFEKQPKTYTCWCGKVQDPFVNELVPHSCGQTCGQSIDCVHGCSSACHPGPHVECSAMGPVMSCACGRSRRQWPCVLTPYKGWSCEVVCGEIMPCGEHTCSRQCHTGLCSVCVETTPAKCFCGKTEKNITCHMDEEMQNQNGRYSCEDVCDTLFDCGIHKCEEICHPFVSHECPLIPSRQTHCYCGQTKNEDLGIERTKCTDAVPTCSLTCSKTLSSCDHKCPQKCHSGDCPPCKETVKMHCSCGRQTFSVPCGTSETPKCTHKCAALLSCRKHYCMDECCEWEAVAIQREKQRKKTGAQIPVEEPKHHCEKNCNRLLKCGIHRCPDRCHSGACKPCMQATSWDDVNCPCGRTTTYAPIRCGTALEVCAWPCERDPPCGHRRIQHTCHSDSEPCPPCPVLMNKPCQCGKSTVKGVRCFQTQVTCSQTCGELLACGVHKCSKHCHVPGECEECTHGCGKTLSCGHVCKAPCHAPFPCDESELCKEKVEVTCECGNIVEERECGGSKSTKRHEEELPCSADCYNKQRLKNMAGALDIAVTRSGERVIDYAAIMFEYPEEIIDFYRQEPSFCIEMEQKIAALVNDESKKVLRFPPMHTAQRAFLHQLAEVYGFTSISQDPEPYRSVSIMQNFPYAAKPPITIRDCVMRRNSSV